MMEPDDATIILMLMDRDEDGVRHLLARHGPQVKGSLMKKLGNVFDEDDLMEILHEAAQRVWLHPEKFDDGKGTLGAWYYMIALNYARDLLRGRTRTADKDRHIVDALEQGFSVPKQQGDLTSPQVAALREAIAELPANQRAIIEADLFALEQDGKVASSEALAKLLNLAKGSISVLRNRAHEALKKALSRIMPPKKGRIEP